MVSTRAEAPFVLPAYHQASLPAPNTHFLDPHDAPNRRLIRSSLLILALVLSLIRSLTSRAVKTGRNGANWQNAWHCVYLSAQNLGILTFFFLFNSQCSSTLDFQLDLRHLSPTTATIPRTGTCTNMS